MKTKNNFIKVLLNILAIIIYLFKYIIWISSQTKKLIKVTHKFIEENLIYFTFLNTLINSNYFLYKTTQLKVKLK